MTRSERKARGLGHADKWADSANDPAAVGSALPGGDGGASLASPPLSQTSSGALERLLLRDDGYLRAIPPRDGRDLYLKWKFTHGRWARYYAMAVVRVDQLGWGLELLERKLLEIDGGLRKPTFDKLHNQMEVEDYA